MVRGIKRRAIFRVDADRVDCVARLWCRVAGQSGRGLPATLGVSHQAVSAAAARGERVPSRWQALWDQWL
jgi:hypothetical protein